MLLAVIFRCENAPDSQTGFEQGISQNNSAVFSRISAIFGVGTLHGKIVSDGEVVQSKRAGRGTVLGEIPDRLKTRPPKTGVLFSYR